MLQAKSRDAYEPGKLRFVKDHGGGGVLTKHDHPQTFHLKKWLIVRDVVQSEVHAGKSHLKVKWLLQAILQLPSEFTCKLDCCGGRAWRRH